MCCSLSLPNIKIVLTGKGRVGTGAKEVLDHMNIKEVTVEDFLNKDFNEAVYVHIDVLDYNKRKDGQQLDMFDFFDNPEEYESTFIRFTEVSDMFIAGHFYGDGAPVFYTKDDMKSSSFKIKVVADISCDIDGPIASTIRSSTIADPIYGYNPQTETECDFTEEGAITVMAVENLPCELPKDASTDFGAEDDTSVAYHVNNNFYYNPGEAFKVPEWKNGYQPLGGENHPLADGKFEEVPAKWTGNGSMASQPDMYDWYETVKVNYGVSPDGKKDFEELPEGFENENYKTHFEFWKDKTVPSSWKKFKDIAMYWTDKGVDGFRYDMAEMVPVEFWSYMNSAIKMENPDAFLLAEVYNPSLYRDYIKKGKMDYLYDKVQLYDTLKHVMQGHGKTDNIPPIFKELSDIEQHMLHFLENHDEQRIASPDFAGSADKGKPAMVISATATTAPTMIYFGQEFGEPGAEDLGFGDPTRTSIFDYGSVPSLVRWVNDKNFDGGQSTKEELELRDFYKRLLNFTINSSALMGEYYDIHLYNQQHTEWYNDKVLSFVRWSDDEKLIIVSNFNDENKIYLKITDNGIGMNQEVVNKLLSNKTLLNKKINQKSIVCWPNQLSVFSVSCAWLFPYSFFDLLLFN